MYIYICTFLLSSLMLFFSEKIKKNIIRRIIVFFSLLLPIVLAAIRSPEIGTDVEYYAIPHFKLALSCTDFSMFLKIFNVSFTSEPLYGFMVYLTSRLSSNYHLSLFAIQTVTVVFVYLGFRRLKMQYNVPIWLGMILYYLMYYNISLNILRQSMSVSIVFYAVTFLIENKKIYYFLFIMIAYGFHGSAIIGLVFFPMYMLLKKSKNSFRFSDINHVVLFLIVVLSGILSLDKVTRIFVNIGLLRTNALNYLGDGNYASSNISWSSICVYLALLFIQVLHIKFLHHRKLEANFFIMISIIMFVCSFGSLISVYISRICYYFVPLHAFALSSVQNCYQRKSKIIWNIMIIFIVLSTWILFFGIKNNHETCPYIVDMYLF